MSSRALDVLDPYETTFADFYFDYLLENKPCVFKNSLTSCWKSRIEWTKDDNKTIPDLEKIGLLFSNSNKIPVSNCKKQIDYGDSNCSTMTLSEYIDLKKSADNNDGCFYLKDWHFQNEFPEYGAYELPIYFQSDWLNEYWDYKKDPVEIDYRFVYIGFEGTWTPYHADVFRSFSWSANVCGRKLWYLTAPKQENDFRLNDYHFMSDIRRTFSTNSSVEVSKVIQEPGEIIFIPSCWHHQVHNLEDTISINHNWFNAANIDFVWAYLRERLNNVQKEIIDLKDAIDDWPDHCQKILKADIGMNYEEFFRLLLYIREQRRQRLSTTADRQNQKRLVDHIDKNELKLFWKSRCQCQPTINFTSLCSSCNNLLIEYDLEVCDRLISDLLKNEDFKSLSCYILCSSSCNNELND